MCCERKEFEIFSCVRGRLGRRAKRREKKQTWQREQKRREKKQLEREQKKAKKTKSREKRKERHKKNFFSKTQILFFFFALLSLEKIHLIERRLRTHQEDFTKTL